MLADEVASVPGGMGATQVRRVTVRRLLQMLGTATASVGVVAVAAALMSLSDTSPPTPIAAPTAVPYLPGSRGAERRAVPHDAGPIRQAAPRPAPSNAPLPMSAPAAVTPIAVVRSSVTTLPPVVVAKTAPVMQVASLQESLSSPPATPEASPAVVQARGARCRRPVHHNDKHGNDRDARTDGKQNHPHPRAGKRAAVHNARAWHQQHQHARTSCTAGDRNNRRPTSAVTATSEKAERRLPRSHRADRHRATRLGPAIRPESELQRRRTTGARHGVTATASTHRHHAGP